MMGFSARMLILGLLGGCASAPASPDATGMPGDPTRHVQAVAVATGGLAVPASGGVAIAVTAGSLRDATGSIGALVADN